MSSESFEVDATGNDSGTATAKAPDASDYGDNVWEFEGIKYPKFVANQTGTITIPIKDPADQTKVIAYIGANFMWTGVEPFVEHMTVDTRDERNVREEETERKRSNLIQKSSKLFADTVQSGHIIKINDMGEKSEPLERSRDEMLKFQPEVQADLIDAWLSAFHVERYFPDGLGDIEALLTDVDKVYFKVRVGDYKNPASIIIFEFDVPNPEARRNYEQSTFSPVQKTEGEKMVTTYYVNNPAKIRFAKKYFSDVQGAVIGKAGEFDINTEDLKAVDAKDKESAKEFMRNICPSWLIVMSDKLVGCFNLGGK